MLMKKILAIILCLAAMLSLCACGAGTKGNTLWQDASPETSALGFSRYYGDSGKAGHLFDQKEIVQILSELSEVDAKPAENWTPEKFRTPAFGLEIGTKDGMGILAAWSNGYLLLRDGSVYEFDYDFPALEDYVWDYSGDISSPAGLPCGRFFALWEGQWYPENLYPAAEKTAPNGISMTITEQSAANVTVELRNDSGEEWCFGEYYSLEVCLDGTWYIVPRTPENWMFTSIGYMLDHKEKQEKSYNLMSYGTLPAGDYRLVVEEMTAEFSLN